VDFGAPPCGWTLLDALAALFASGLELHGWGLAPSGPPLNSAALVVSDLDSVGQRSVDWAAGGDFAEAFGLGWIEVAAEDQFEIDRCGFALGWLPLQTDGDLVQRPLSPFGIQPNCQDRSGA